MSLNYEEILKLSEEKKIEALKKLFEKDSSYLKKLLLLLTMGDEAESLLQMMADNKREEIELFKKIYKINELQDTSLETIKKLIDNRDFSGVMGYIMSDGADESNYARACREVLEVLKHISKDNYEKISKNFIQKLEKDADMQYEFSLSTPLEKTIFLEETKDILALIQEKYWKDNDVFIKTNDDEN